jgi:GT2 family glycosyltransferase
MKKPLVSIIILNWNGKEMTRECLRSLRKLKFKDYAVIVVDNGSTDGSSEFIKKRFPNIKLIHHKKNLGFAHGNNSALDCAKGKYLALLNNDMVVDPLWLTRLVKVAEKDKHIGACGGGRFDWNEKNPPYNKKNILRTIKHIYKYTGFPWEENGREKLEEVDTLSGGVVLIRRKAIDKIGLFDPAFFAYVEDRDFFARMKRAGYKIRFVPKAYIWHRISRTGKRNKYKFSYLSLRNHLFYLFKNFDPGYLQIALLFYFLREVKSTIKEAIVNQRDFELEKVRFEVFLWFLRNFNRLMRMRKKNLKQFPNSKYNNLIGNL